MTKQNNNPLLYHQKKYLQKISTPPHLPSFTPHPITKIRHQLSILPTLFLLCFSVVFTPSKTPSFTHLIFILFLLNFITRLIFFINFLTINYASTNLPLYTNSHCWFFPPIVSSPRYFMVMQRFLQVSCNAFYKFGHAHFRLKTAIFWWSIKYSLRNFSILHQFLI